ncbi:MAG: hypothetical protein ACRD3W_11625, partial [Terriglobales bacterium]
MVEARIGTNQSFDVLYDHHAQIGAILHALTAGDEPYEPLVYDLFVELRVHSILEQQLFFPAIAALIRKEQIRSCGTDFYLMLALMLELEQIEPGNEQFKR